MNQISTTVDGVTQELQAFLSHTACRESKQVRALRTTLPTLFSGQIVAHVGRVVRMGADCPHAGSRHDRNGSWWPGTPVDDGVVDED